MKKNHLFLFILLFVSLSCTQEQQQRTIIQTDKAPEAIGPYSQGILTGNTLYTAGQVGLDPETGSLVGEDIESQTRQVMSNLKAVLEEAGFDFTDVVSVDVYLLDLSDYALFNEIYIEFFTENPPVRAVVGVQRLPLDAKVEVKLIAVKR